MKFSYYLGIFKDWIFMGLLAMCLFIWQHNHSLDEAYAKGVADTCSKVKEHSFDIYMDLSAHDICH